MAETIWLRKDRLEALVLIETVRTSSMCAYQPAAGIRGDCISVEPLEILTEFLVKSLCIDSIHHVHSFSID